MALLLPESGWHHRLPMAMMKFFAIWIFKPVVIVL